MKAEEDARERALFERDSSKDNDAHVVTEKRSQASGIRGWLSKKWNEYEEGAERLKKKLGSAASGAWHGLFGGQSSPEDEARRTFRDDQTAAFDDPNSKRVLHEAELTGKGVENETAEVAREGTEQAFEAGKTYAETELGGKAIGAAAGALKVGGKAVGRELGALKAEERALAAEERAVAAQERALATQERSIEYNIAPHGEQPSPRRGTASHHGVQQEYLKRNVPGYDPKQDPTILLQDAPGGPHKKITGEQAARRPQMERELGNKYGADYGAERAAAIEQMRRAGVPENKIGQWVLEHDAYLFETGKKR